MTYPVFPFEELLNFQKLMFEKVMKNNQNFFKALNILTNPPAVEVGTTPAEVVYKIKNIKLLHYKALTDKQERVPILIIYALINRPYILDLQPDRSVVKFLLQNGFDVYLIDWDEPKEKDHLWTIDDYVNTYIDRIVKYVKDESGLDKITILGYCMGGTLSTIYTALHPDNVKNLMIMAAPIYFDTDESLLHVWANPDYFDVDLVVDTLGNIPPDFLNGGYAFLDPVGNNYSKYLKFVENVDNDAFVRMFLRMEKWINDGIPLAGETFREFLKYGYQQNLLVQNKWKVNGETVNLKNIDMPILTIIGQYDNLVPPSATKPLLDYVASTDKKEILLPTGHIGLSVSSKSHRELWPKVVDWLKSRSSDGMSIKIESSQQAPSKPPRKTSRRGTRSKSKRSRKTRKK